MKIVNIKFRTGRGVKICFLNVKVKGLILKILKNGKCKIPSRKGCQSLFCQLQGRGSTLCSDIYTHILLFCEIYSQSNLYLSTPRGVLDIMHHYLSFPGGPWYNRNNNQLQIYWSLFKLSVDLSISIFLGIH